MTHTPAMDSRRSVAHLQPRTVIVALVLIAGVLGGTLLLQHSSADRLVIPDEKAVAAALLEQKLSGPRYFQRSAPAGDVARATRAPFLRDAEPLIGVADARSQVPRIVAERRLPPETAAKIDQLIEQLTNPPNSRAAGEASVHLLRLNLALDELR